MMQQGCTNMYPSYTSLKKWHAKKLDDLSRASSSERCDGNVVGGQGGWTGGTRTDTRCLRQQRHSQDKQGNGTQHVLSLPQGSIHTYYVQPTERERDTAESASANAGHTVAPQTPSSHRANVIRSDYFVVGG